MYKHRVFAENQLGVSYDDLFGDYVKGAKQLTITDPYIRIFYQARNLMEFLETVVRFKSAEDEVAIHLITTADQYTEQQTEYLFGVKTGVKPPASPLRGSTDETNSLHTRHVTADHGWKMSVDRGLDIFQRCELNDVFALSNRVQQMRPVKAFEVTYLEIDFF